MHCYRNLLLFGVLVWTTATPIEREEKIPPSPSPGQSSHGRNVHLVPGMAPGSGNKADQDPDECRCPFRADPHCSTSGRTFASLCELECSQQVPKCNQACPCGEGVNSTSKPDKLEDDDVLVPPPPEAEAGKNATTKVAPGPAPAPAPPQAPPPKDEKKPK